MHDFFVSHCSKDKNTIVDNLVENLQNMGYSVWYDKEQILAGDDISTEVKKGLNNSFCLLLVISSNFIKSKWTFYETGIFDATGSERIIPLVYNASKDDKAIIQGILGNRKYLDASTLTKEEMATNLTRKLNQIKKENNDLQITEELKNIQKKLASYETVNSEIISIKLKEYLDFLETHSDFLILAAKKMVKAILEDLLKHAGLKSNCTNIDNEELSDLIKKYKIGSLNTQEYLDFILTLDSEKVSQENIRIINHALINILNYYTHTKYSLNLSSTQIEIVSPEELTFSDFVDMFEIDKKVMREDLIADVNTTYGWYTHNKYTHIAVRDKSSKKVVGYFSVLPITDDTYQKILDGDFKDKDFTTESIEQYIFSDFYRIYIAGVGIDPKYQNTSAFIKLYNALIDLFLFLAKDREIYISEVLAEASTKQGEKFCKMVGMKCISNTKSDTEIYGLITIPPEFRLPNRKGKEMHELCKKKFEEYRDYFECK